MPDLINTYISKITAKFINKSFKWNDKSTWFLFFEFLKNNIIHKYIYLSALKIINTPLLSAYQQR